MKIKTSTLTPIMGLIALIIAAMVVPVGNTNDIYLSVMVEKPLCAPFTTCSESAKIIDITGYAVPHTIIESPYLAEIGGITSGSLKLSAEAGNIKIMKGIGTIWKNTANTYQLTLRDVPKTQTNVVVSLYEDNAITDMKNVIITEAK